jgi:hypothetical protein
MVNANPCPCGGSGSVERGTRCDASLADGPISGAASLTALDSNVAVEAIPADAVSPVVSGGTCVNGSVPGPYGCHSTAASSTYYNYPQSPYYYQNLQTAYNYCYTYYPYCQYYHTYDDYPSYYYYPSSSYSSSYYYCTIPGGGVVWIQYGQSTAGMICT